MGERVPLDEALARQLAKPEVRAEYERNAVADAVSLWLVRFRADHGLSQADLATRTGRSQPAVARIEAGDVEPRLSTLLRIARALGVDLLVALEAEPGAVTVRQAA
ncbi:MAG: helix-turn-helix domain-containing protein [Armatimonadetes bacterium]|nr:helix-turn-helix domain-containing protein [Armatimonadota bacterium]